MKNTSLHQDLYMNFIAALFTIASSWESLEVHQQVNGYTECVIYIMEYCSATRKNEQWIHMTPWMNLKYK